ncbi:MAG: SAM-dependent methyltransferase [Rhodobacter sp.]|jgi:SAM-dependent MidA family methyltransferase|nr:SAM-dependent methyltransferase [Rhodobacter sp.]
MTPLAQLLTRRIAAAGPISIAEYMTDCLMHPQFGYYATRDPLGIDGDFTTAPEISQMFGELIGLALAQAWVDQGCPDRITLAELGPGRGTCMADILRTVRAVPGLLGAAEVHLVEASPVLRARQRDALGGRPVTWHDGADTLPDAPLFLIANEFFDALPIRQFIRHRDGWCERLIGTDGDALTFGLGTPAPLALLDHRLGDTRPGDLVETCAPAQPVIAEISRRIAAHGGAALVIDYGDWRSQGDTLQAVRAHAATDPLADPGEADLTAHVDFEALALAAAGTGHSKLTTQGVFLERLGITQRARALSEQLGGIALESHIAAHRRLTHPAEMGSLFKVFGLTPVGSKPLAGLDP